MTADERVDEMVLEILRAAFADGAAWRAAGEPATKDMPNSRAVLARHMDEDEDRARAACRLMVVLAEKYFNRRKKKKDAPPAA